MLFIICSILAFFALRALWLEFNRISKDNEERVAMEKAPIYLSKEILPDFSDSHDMIIRRINVSSAPILEYWFENVVSEETKSKLSPKVMRALKKRINSYRCSLERKEEEKIRKGMIFP